MAAAVTAILRERWGDAWVGSAAAAPFWSHLEQVQEQLQAKRPRDVLLAEPDPIRFLAAFLAATQQPCRIWLSNPRWGQQEWTQVAAQCQPDWVEGKVPAGLWQNHSMDKTDAGVECRDNRECQILIPTGGSSGNIRFAMHTWKTLAASVEGFRQHFNCEVVNAYCVLPLFHVSGLMQALRCWLSGGQLLIQPFQALQQQGAIASLPKPCFLSLVPTQLQRLLLGDRALIPWLRQFTAILIGGGPTWPSLLQSARQLCLPLAPTYGMTETASQVVTLLPSAFLSGNTSSGRALPHAELTICNNQGGILPPHHTGRIAIAATSLANGYWSGPAFSQPFYSSDLGYLDDFGDLHVVGREQTLIVTGGEKVQPEEVEAAILATGQMQDVAVLGIPDADWGERVVAVIVPRSSVWERDRLIHFLKSQLSPYKLPKQWLVSEHLPRNAQGKLNRAALQQWVQSQGRSTDAATALTQPSVAGVGE